MNNFNYINTLNIRETNNLLRREDSIPSCMPGCYTSTLCKPYHVCMVSGVNNLNKNKCINMNWLPH